jgi:hypothetical protein
MPPELLADHLDSATASPTDWDVPGLLTDAASAIRSATMDNVALQRTIRMAADNCRRVVAILHETAGPNSVIGTDLIGRLNYIITTLEGSSEGEAPSNG